MRILALTLIFLLFTGLDVLSAPVAVGVDAGNVQFSGGSGGYFNPKGVWCCFNPLWIMTAECFSRLRWPLTAEIT